MCSKTRFVWVIDSDNRLSTELRPEVQPAAALTHLPQAWMLTLAEAVEISLGGVTFQAAVDYKLWDGGVAQSHAATQGPWQGERRAMACHPRPW